MAARYLYATALLVVAIATAAAAPPTLELPKEVTGDPGSFIQVQAKTDGKHVSWRAVDPGLNLFPVELLKDSKVAVVTAPHPGRYRLIAITAAGDELSAFAEVMVVVGNAPQPPPTPDPPGPTPDPPAPAPTGFRVIFVYESAATLPTDQFNAMHARDVMTYLDAKTAQEENWPGWRRWDKDTTAANETPIMKALWEAVKTKITSVPCVVVAVNGKAEIHPFPANAKDMLAFLKRFGG